MSFMKTHKALNAHITIKLVALRRFFFQKIPPGTGWDSRTLFYRKLLPQLNSRRYGKNALSPCCKEFLSKLKQHSLALKGGRFQSTACNCCCKMFIVVVVKEPKERPNAAFSLNDSLTLIYHPDYNCRALQRVYRANQHNSTYSEGKKSFRFKRVDTWAAVVKGV